MRRCVEEFAAEINAAIKAAEAKPNPAETACSRTST
jgi:hypothetical protein